MNYEIKKCLKKSNRKFYNDNVASELKVTLISSGLDNNKWWNEFIDGNENVKIFAGKDYPNEFSFSHEMLHLYLFANGFASHAANIDCYQRLRFHIVDAKILSDEIANCTAHYKMLPIFTKKLKYKKVKFFANWERLVHDDDISKLTAEYKCTCPNQCIHFTNFIKFFFYTRYHFNDDLSQEYIDYQDKLKKIDEILYKILLDSCTLWEKDMTNYNNLEFINTLYPKLNEYLQKRGLPDIKI
jgi:hypothetical protein